MDFLNEAASRFPNSHNLASGRPCLQTIRACMPWLGTELLAATTWTSKDGFCQYGPTAGSICESVARWASRRADAVVDPENLLITTGAQEAITIALLATCEPGRDAVLVADPAYVGILGAAITLGIDIVPMGRLSSLDGAALEAAVQRARAIDRVARLTYVVPDYDNPTGESLAGPNRTSFVAAAERNDLVVLEDTAYREFGYDGAPSSSLLSMRRGTVLQIGTFAKIAFPALRLGYICTGSETRSGPLIAALRMSKSFTTLNTAGPTQAIVQTILADHGERLADGARRLCTIYARRRDMMQESLNNSGLAEHGVRWTVPRGGFFFSVSLPFEFDSEEMLRCASDFGVTCMPMRYFSTTTFNDCEVRLSFSAIDITDLSSATDGFVRYLRARLRTRR